jgi:glutathione synthase/RimK-type ligase-like ATP-grasp enzyme
MAPAERVAVVSCAQLPVADPDRDLVADALVEHGVEACWVAWDDPSVDWASFAGAWIRTPWDYVERRDAFVAWARRVESATRLWNPADVVAWNSHKSYLLDLESRGVPIVPTVLVAAGEEVDLAGLGRDRGWDDVVVKPAVSAGAVGATHVLTTDARASSALELARRHGDALVQPFQREVARGETSVVVVEGEPTHAVSKVPAEGDYRVQVQHGGLELPHTPTLAELDLARQAVASVGRTLLYARVDMVADEPRDLPRLMELELIEPALFLAHAPSHAVDRLAGAVAERLRRSGPR